MYSAEPVGTLLLASARVTQDDIQSSNAPKNTQN
jgi:hypothetical protein